MPTMRSLVVSGVALLSLACALPACSGKDPYSPGTKLGTFHVTAKLTQTTCGATPDPWEFDVRLNHEGSMLYWVQTDAPPIEGQVDASARTQLAAELVLEVRPADVKAKREACTIARRDVLAVTLADANAQPTSDPALLQSFTGSLVYTFTPTSGSDCSDQVTASGGDFATLPCEVRYDLAGTFKSAPR